MDDLKYWVALSAHPKIGSRTLIKLYKRFQKMSRIWRATAADLAAAGLSAEQTEEVLAAVAKISPDKEIQKLAKYQIDALIFPDKNYPKLLKEISDPPAILYVKGKIEPADEIAVAVVGSRKFTPYGQRAAATISEQLAANNITVISGLALGIDTIAHQAALAAGGRTLAVFGCGLDQIYPVSNIRLADKIITRGALISEYPVGTPAYPGNFPLRNRIIAGLSLGTVVAEGAVESGSLITARAALDYNREVFAVPGPIFSPESEGPNRLIQMGAKLIISADDILDELDIKNKIQQKYSQTVIPDCPEEEIMLKLLEQPKLVDQIILESKLNSALVNSTLIMLEMKGKIANLGGTAYVIKGRLKRN